MPRVLHIVKDRANQIAFDVLAEQSRDPSIALAVVLAQEAADLTGPLPGEVFRLGAGAGDSPYPAIDHARLLDLIFAADTVVTW
jgi:hypothetical protein